MNPLAEAMMKLGNPVEGGGDDDNRRRMFDLRFRRPDDEVPVQNPAQEFVSIKAPNTVIPPEVEKSLHGMPEDVLEQFGFRRVMRHPNNPWAPEIQRAPQPGSEADPQDAQRRLLAQAMMGRTGP